MIDSADNGDTSPSGVKRRDFLKVLGVGGAATAMLGCAQEKVEKLIPYLVSPDQTVPGVSTYYATTCRECATGCGVIAETRDGRTTKLEGNPAHPVNQGALCSRGQSARRPRLRGAQDVPPSFVSNRPTPCTIAQNRSASSGSDWKPEIPR